MRHLSSAGRTCRSPRRRRGARAKLPGTSGHSPLSPGTPGAGTYSRARAERSRWPPEVAHGEVILGREVAARAMASWAPGRSAVRVPFPELTAREREVLDLLARGHDNGAIARRLVLSPKTVRNHVANVLTELAVPHRTAAAVLAREAGLGGEAAP